MSNSLVAARRVGRMGNNFFQVATSIAVALDHGLDWRYFEYSMAPAIWPNNLHIEPSRIIPNDYRDMPVRVVTERSHAYNDIILNSMSDCLFVLDGYFQSEKYFAHHRDVILHTFNIPYVPLNDHCSVHIRRTDYLELADKHPPVTETYLMDATSYMRNKGYTKFVFFSDDIPWVKSFLNRTNLGPEIETIISESSNPMADLSYMSSCGSNIIANSSFSWWGAWLNQNPDKHVCVTEKWFGPGNAHLDYKDIIPDSWIKIPV